MSFQGSAGSRPPKSNISGYKQHQIQKFTPEQMQLFQMFSQALQGGLGGEGGGLDTLSRLAAGDEEIFGQLEAPAYSAFNQQIGQLGSRFGDIGAVGSSGFQNATSGAAGQFAEKLGSNRIGLQQSAIDKLLGLSTSFLGQRPFEDKFTKDSEGMDWLGLLGGALGAFGGPALGAVGGGLGSWANKKLFG
jgi:hypothetical protein